MNLDGLNDIDKEEECQILDVTTANNDQYDNFINEIIASRNRITRNNLPYKVILICGTDFGDIFTVYDKTKQNIPIETFWRIKNKNDSNSNGCHLSENDNNDKNGLKDLIYIPYDNINNKVNWELEPLSYTNTYNYLFDPLSFYINDSSPYYNLIQLQNIDIRYLAYIIVKEIEINDGDDDDGEDDDNDDDDDGEEPGSSKPIIKPSINRRVLNKRRLKK